MPAVASLLEEHHQSALSVGLRSAFASLKAELHTVQVTVSDFGEQIVSLVANGNLTEERIQALKVSYSALSEACAKLKAKNINMEG